MLKSYDPLAAYQPDPLVYDELGRGAVPDHWRAIIDHFGNVANNAEQVAPEQIRSEMLVRDLDIQRPWALDPVPFTLPDHEWQEIETGLVQRTRLLNAVLADLYGKQTLLSTGGLPPALVHGNPRFLLPLFNYNAADANFLSLAAFDLGRSPDGIWRVLADWTEAPQGLGMCLENRLLSAQAFPDLLADQQILRVRDFFISYAQRFQQIGSEYFSEDGINVILSPGPDDASYFEHVYLGQYFGFPVVEGADLTVRGNSLQIKTLEGLKPVSALWRYTDSKACDPLYLDTHSRYGTAGLVNIARQRRVHVINALGAGVVENDAFMSFLPGLCERFLGEELSLPSVATWWCGQPESAADALDKQAELAFTSAFNRAEMFDTDVDSLQATSAPPANLDYRHVAREPINLSHSPYLDESGVLRSGATTVRLFVARLNDGYRLLPGGIARISTPQGVLTKDVWATACALKTIVTKPVPLTNRRRSDRDLASRTADDLFWLGRYLERCEGAARAYRCLFRRLAEQGMDERQQTTETILELLVDLQMISAAQAQQLARQVILPGNLAGLIFDPDSTDGIGNLLGNIFNLASQVRERLSADAWRMFTALANTPDRNRWNIGSSNEAAAFFDRLLERLSALNGQIQENMTRSYGWRLLELGRRLERGQFGLHILHALVNQSTSPTHLYLLLDLFDSAITYRSRYRTLPTLGNLLQLLLMDEVNPRSMIYQIQRLQDVMQEMPLDQESDGLSESQRILMSAYHELTLADPLKLAEVVSKAGNRTQLRRVLQRLENTFSSLSELITDTYFSHTTGSGQAR